MSDISEDELSASAKEVKERISNKQFVMFCAADWLKHEFGERCPEFSDNCECCRRWKLFDQMFAEVPL